MSVSNIGSKSPQTPAEHRSQETQQSPAQRSGIPAQTTSTPPAGDTVHLSSAAVDMLALEAKISELPDVDKARVTELRSQIANGEYTVNASRVAEKILGFETGLN